ncbi:MAG: hypothetical protein IJW82_05290 [Clostridia bacterium]|nr:hypothetical protein [Clostridia bacterium]
MEYYFPFGQKLKSLEQEDRTPKRVYASVVHARWINKGQIICQALAVASEPRIFWDGNIDEAKNIIKSINIPNSTLEEYSKLYGYGTQTEVVIYGKTIKVLSFVHLRQIGALGLHSEKWYLVHKEWEKQILKSLK